MIDLSNELTGVCQAYAQIVARQRGAVLQFMGVHPGAGVSTCARAFARLMTPRLQGGVLLVDLDFYRNGQYGAFASQRAQAIYGPVGPALPASMGKAPLFWNVHPKLVRQDGRKAGDQFYVNMHKIGAHKLYVSKFRADLLRRGQLIQLRQAKAYWANMRAKVDLSILDAPSLAQSQNGLITAADADGVVIVAHPAHAGAKVHALRQQIERRGGRCLGIVYNAAPMQAPRQAHLKQAHLKQAPLGAAFP